MRNEYEREVDKLIGALEVAVKQQEKLPGFYELITDNDNIKSAEALRTIQICESDSMTAVELLSWLRYTKKPRNEYKLTLGSNGRYNAGDNELTCGRSIELFVDDGQERNDKGWQFGRVEHSDEYGGYYFYNESGRWNQKLDVGSRVAIRW